MSFPRNPADGQKFVINGLAYIYNAAKKTWGYVKGTAGSTRDAGGFVIQNVGDARVRPDGEHDAMNRKLVEELIAANSLFQGTWHVSTNKPDLSPAVAKPLHTYSWIAQTVDPKVPEVVGALGIAGLDGKSIDAGDVIIWNAKLSTYEIVKGAPLTLVNAMDVFIEESGDTMTGPLVLHGDPTDDLEATPKRYVDSEIVRLIGAAITALDPTSFLRKAGGVMTGPLALSGAPTTDVHAATKKYVDDGDKSLIAVTNEGVAYPFTPELGRLWINDTQDTASYYDGADWVELGMRVPRLDAAPAGADGGRIYYDKPSKKLLINAGDAATPVWTPVVEGGGGNTGAVSAPIAADPVTGAAPITRGSWYREFTPTNTKGTSFSSGGTNGTGMWQMPNKPELCPVPANLRVASNRFRISIYFNGTGRYSGNVYSIIHWENGGAYFMDKQTHHSMNNDAITRSASFICSGNANSLDWMTAAIVGGSGMYPSFVAVTWELLNT